MKLSEIKAERREGPLWLLLYGHPGIGKTTFASRMPKPLFVGTEYAGSDELHVARYDERIETIEQFRRALDRVETEEHDFKTLVIDTADKIEEAVFADVCKRASVNHIDEIGYGKGQNAAQDYWRDTLARFERISTKRGMNIVILAHETRRTVKNPSGDNYMRWEPNIHEKSSGLVVHWAKAVLYAEEPVSASAMSKTDKTAKGFSDGTRQVRTKWNALYEAKNRFNLPDPMPLDFDAFVAGVKSGRDAIATRSMILARIEELNRPEVTSKVKEALKTAGDDLLALSKVNDKVEAAIMKYSQTETKEATNG